MTCDTPELQALGERLENLEAQNRKLKRAWVTILAVLSDLVLMGLGRP